MFKIIVVCLVVFSAIASAQTNLYSCIDWECEEWISKGKTLIRYMGKTEKHLSFKKNEDIVIVSKPIDAKQPDWVGKVGAKVGLVPKDMVREDRINKSPTKFKLDLKEILDLVLKTGETQDEPVDNINGLEIEDVEEPQPPPPSEEIKPTTVSQEYQSTEAYQSLTDTVSGESIAAEVLPDAEVGSGADQSDDVPKIIEVEEVLHDPVVLSPAPESASSVTLHPSTDTVLQGGATTLLDDYYIAETPKTEAIQEQSTTQIPVEDQVTPALGSVASIQSIQEKVSHGNTGQENVAIEVTKVEKPREVVTTENKEKETQFTLNYVEEKTAEVVKETSVVSGGDEIVNVSVEMSESVEVSPGRVESVQPHKLGGDEVVTENATTETPAENATVEPPAEKPSGLDDGEKREASEETVVSVNAEVREEVSSSLNEKKEEEKKIELLEEEEEEEDDEEEGSEEEEDDEKDEELPMNEEVEEIAHLGEGNQEATPPTPLVSLDPVAETVEEAVSTESPIAIAEPNVDEEPQPKKTQVTQPVEAIPSHDTVEVRSDSAPEQPTVEMIPTVEPIHDNVTAETSPTPETVVPEIQVPVEDEASTASPIPTEIIDTQPVTDHVEEEASTASPIPLEIIDTKSEKDHRAEEALVPSPIPVDTIDPKSETTAGVNDTLENVSTSITDASGEIDTLPTSDSQSLQDQVVDEVAAKANQITPDSDEVKTDEAAFASDQVDTSTPVPDQPTLVDMAPTQEMAPVTDTEDTIVPNVPVVEDLPVVEPAALENVSVVDTPENVDVNSIASNPNPSTNDSLPVPTALSNSTEALPEVPVPEPVLDIVSPQSDSPVPLSADFLPPPDSLPLPTEETVPNLSPSADPIEQSAPELTPSSEEPLPTPVPSEEVPPPPQTSEPEAESSDDHHHHHHHHRHRHPRNFKYNASSPFPSSLTLVIKHISSTLLSFLPEALQDTIFDVDDALVFTGIIALTLVSICVPYIFISGYMSVRPLRKKVVDLNKSLWKVSAAYETQQEEFEQFKRKALAHDAFKERAERSENDVAILKTLEVKQREQIQSLKTQLKTLTKEAGDIRALIERTLKDKLIVEEERTKFQTQATTATEALAKLKDDIGQYQNQAKSQTLQIAMANKNGEVMSEKIKLLEEQVDQLKSQLEQEVDKRRVVAEELETAREAKKQVDNELDQIKTICKGYEETVETLNNQIFQVESELTTLKETLGDDSPLLEVAEVQAKAEFMEREASSLRTRLEGVCGDNENLQGRLEITTSNLEETKQERDTVVKKLQVLEEYFKEREAQLLKDLEVIQAKDAVRDKGKDQLIEMVEEKDSAISELKNLVESIKEELEESKVQHRNEIRGLESKGHENWLSLCQAERKAQDARKEAELLRQRLTALMKEREREVEEEEDSDSGGDGLPMMFAPIPDELVPPPILDDEESPPSYFGLGDFEPPLPLPDDEDEVEPRRRPPPLGGTRMSPSFTDSSDDDLRLGGPIRRREEEECTDGSSGSGSPPIRAGGWVAMQQGRRFPPATNQTGANL